MIIPLISLLLDQLNHYIKQQDGNPLGMPNVAVMGNIAQIDIPEVATDLENRLVLSLINLEEEATLKNGRNAVPNTDGTVGYPPKPLHLNLFLLWTANYRNYGTALQRLSQVMIFLQGKQKFTPTNSPGVQGVEGLDFSLTMELLSLNLEEINHLWGVLGGKYLPSVVYRGRVVTLQDRRWIDRGGLIQEVALTSRGTTL